MDMHNTLMTIILLNNEVEVDELKVSDQHDSTLWPLTHCIIFDTQP